MHPETITDNPRSGVLDIAWSDGSSQQFKHALLRSQCPCADCKAARLQKQSAITVLPEIRIQDIRPTGTYGMQLLFSDGHDRGIYPWTYLRQLPNNDG